mgnify:CR=1 FL=1
MKLAASNIAWNSASDETMYAYLVSSGFEGLEIAPTRIIQDMPYDRLDEAACFAQELQARYDLTVCSMQSIWFGRQEQMFHSKEEREILLQYTKKAIDFAHVMQCGNVVFGCPKNRVIQERSQYGIAIAFFEELGEYAYRQNTVLAIEANPVIYQTNFVNTTQEALQLCRDIGSKGIAVNLDCGTIVQNEETIQTIAQDIALVNHVHVSEPYLAVLENRSLHTELAAILRMAGYQKFVSIEMRQHEDLAGIKAAIAYVGEIYA